MTLTPDMFPLTVSVRDTVLKRFTHPESLLQGAQHMDPQELSDYLLACGDTSLSPLDAVLQRADELGDPTLPAPSASALLAWVGAAFSSWERDFPLDPAIRGELRKLKATVARAALSDPAFTTPGAHPAHQLLDALHAAAIGWQEDLGRSGDSVLKLLQDTSASLTDSSQLGAAPQIQLQLEAAIESARRLDDRNTRMCQRAADVERAKLRSEHARDSAASAINEALARAPLPGACGEFLRGPWFESAQLVLLKFGLNSGEWQAMQASTLKLVESLGPTQGAPTDDLEASASAIRKSLERWLLSLQHQPDAPRGTLGELEYLLLRALGGQSIERSPQLPIEIPGRPEGGRAPTRLPAEIAVGSWLLVRSGAGAPQRMQVILRQDERQQLMLCRHSGLQTKSMHFSDFLSLLREKRVALLPSGASFSRALASTAGVKAPAADETGAGAARPAPAPKSDKTAAQAPRKVAEQDAGVTAAGEPLPLPPLGSWLGFHDVDPPLLARLAMHDAVRGLLILVNRKGMEIRRLEEAQYISLVQEGMIDLLETRSNFRQEVERARRRMQRHEQSQQ